MIERSLSFGNGLVGTLCLPDGIESGNNPATAGIILFNSGIVHRIGPHRINVKLARDLAKLGIPSIRFDLAGLGDSTRASGEISFEAQAVNDIRTAMTALEEATGLQRFGLFGFCSGAFHSYNAAHMDDRIAAILLFDAFRYPTLKSALIRLSLRFREHGTLATITRLAFKIPGQLAKRLYLHGAADTKRIRISEVGFIVDSPSTSSFAQGVRHLLGKGISVSMVFAGDGFEVYNYERQFHDVFKKFGIMDRVPVTFLPDIDHVATGIHAQGELIQHLLDWSAQLAGVNLARPGPQRRVTDSPLPRRAKQKARPSAIVLSRTITGLGTVRSLGKVGIDVHAIYFEKHDPVRFSRYCRASYFDDTAEDERALLNHVVAYAQQLGNRPVVVPTCDAHTLMLARHRDELRPYCRIMAGEYSTLATLINKDGLYAHARAAQVSTIPSIVAPNLAEATEWSTAHPAPYLIKPFYTGVPTARLKQKNLVLPSRDALLAYVREGSMDALIVQRLIRGGDGYIYDYYGFTNREGYVIAQASRRRWRQNIPDYGTCTVGEIPADARTEASIFANSQRLLSQSRYQGIAMIEWLYDRDTGELHVIDFNARPFMGIGHLTAAGLNLPALAYAKLIGEDVSGVVQTPKLRHLVGLDLLRDIESFLAKRARGEIGLLEWLNSLRKCGYYYYVEWQDPGPGIARLMQIFSRGISFLMRSRKHGSRQPG